MAQPFRKISHNGEINTLRGNINSLLAREQSLASDFPEHPLSTLPSSVNKQLSDSGIFDAAIARDLMFTEDIFETLLGFSPDPQIKYPATDFDRKINSFYKYKSLSREAWDGPAFIGFCHGSFVGAKLDRNGLRPARFTLTHDGEFLVSSENGVIDIDENKIIKKGRLAPGEIIAVNIDLNSVLQDKLIKKMVSNKSNYCDKVKKNIIDIQNLSPSRFYGHIDPHHLTKTTKAACYYYTREELNKILIPMATDGKEPIGSMGNDTTLAVLSQKPRLLYDYFKQIFAQVTNPAIDSIREVSKTSMECFVGARKIEVSKSSLNEPTIALDSPILTSAEYDSLVLSKETAERIAHLDASFDDRVGMQKALDEMKERAKYFIAHGKTIIVINDFGANVNRTPIPMLLAVSSLHHELIKVGLRNKVSLIAQTAEAREIHHFATLVGFGANAIYPEMVYLLINETLGDSIPRETAEYNFKKAATSGITKIMSKIGISTVQSYFGAQVFECVGIRSEVINEHFRWVVTKIEGITFDIIENDAVRRKARGLIEGDMIPSEGLLSWRSSGEARTHTPSAVLNFQKAVNLKSAEAFKEFCNEIDDKPSPVNLRDIYNLKSTTSTAIDISEVEPIENILVRFTSGAMSLGSISKEAHETIAIAMNQVGARSNSGEGGEDKARAKIDKYGNNRRSAIKQIASGRFGVDLNYLVNADELQIKVAQGAKPGEGGQLPAHKVTLEIGKVRGSTPGVSLISPPPHHDIYSIEDLAQLIYDLKSVNPDAKVSVKLVSGTGVGTIAAGVAKAKADIILISGGDGGTGASPLNSLYHAGLPWEIGLAETHKTLVENGLRDRVTLQTDGGLRTPKDMILASILGAEEWGLGSVSLMAIGCIMMRKCHLNTCPVGIATQNPELRKLFKGTPENLVTYLIALASEIRQILANLGIRDIDSIIGRTDLLEKKQSFGNENIEKKVATINLDSLLFSSKNYLLTKKFGQNHDLDKRFDQKILIPKLEEFMKVKSQTHLNITASVVNEDRSIGTSLSSMIEKIKCGLVKASNLPTAITINFEGTAGQSYMAYASSEITAHLHGEANDYVGKGLSGATLSIEPKNKSIEDPVLIGNTALYGATSGSLYVAGTTGERFAVRNSGAIAVVEGVGEHALEYMTGGTVVILGAFGDNLAAGMSGGISYIFDPMDEIKIKINKDMLGSIEKIDETEIRIVHKLISKHRELTKSPKANSILENWATLSKCFKAIKPLEYKQALKRLGKCHTKNLEALFKSQTESSVILSTEMPSDTPTQ